ncbi:hypothetical protein Pr1d_09150 [Bythopirellula goksoeyrii]|uniref:Uncharacterized protein n=1 Tax=Bythopirellula goksoeyrii TaxID=1400387 RepID=A0A5B9QHF1_9BACT|nr:hypothetical protein Pr1d_09150 [Bythopirellula goksoeyrii]
MIPREIPGRTSRTSSAPLESFSGIKSLAVEVGKIKRKMLVGIELVDRLALAPSGFDRLLSYRISFSQWPLLEP